MKNCLHRSLLLVSVALTTGAPLATAHRPDAIVAGRYVTPDGELGGAVAVTIANGKIEAVTELEQFKESGDIVRFPHAVLSPGLIDLHSHIGAVEQLTETAEAIDPTSNAIDAIDFNHPEFRKTVRAGITTAMVAPSPNNLVGGSAAVIKTYGGRDAALRAHGPLTMTFGSTVWSYDRAPTSRMGAVAMLRSAIEESSSTTGHLRLRSFKEGDLDALVHCGEAMDVSSALRTLTAPGRKLTILYTGDETGLAEELAGYGVPVVLGPFDFDAPQRVFRTAAAFAQQSVPVVFAGHTPHESGIALRRTANLAVRYGMDAPEARKAMTTTPAEAVGVAERVGSIHPGLDADFVVFSDDPLRLDARILEVYINGERVYAADLQ